MPEELRISDTELRKMDLEGKRLQQERELKQLELEQTAKLHSEDLDFQKQQLGETSRLRDEELDIQRRQADATRLFITKRLSVSPTTITLAVSVVAVLGTIWAAIVQASKNLELERQKFNYQKTLEGIRAENQSQYQREADERKFRSDLVLNAIKTGNPKEAKENLLFLIEANLLRDPDNKIRTALTQHQPSLPAPNWQNTKTDQGRIEAASAELHSKGVDRDKYRAIRVAKYVISYQRQVRWVQALKSQPDYRRNRRMPIELFYLGLYAEYADRLTEARTSYIECLKHPLVHDVTIMTRKHRPVIVAATEHLKYVDDFLRSGKPIQEFPYHPL